MYKTIYYLLLVTFFTGDLFASKIEDKMHSMELISGYEQIADSSAIYMGLKFEFPKGWKTYWKNPGVVGYPLRVDFSQSKNIKDINVLWPAPEEFTTFELKSYGYSGSVILPLLVTLEDPQKGVEANIEFDYLICDPINCIPRKHRLILDVPEGEINKRSPFFNDIEHYLAKIPLPDTGEGLTIEKAEIDESPESYYEITVTAYKSDGFKDPEIFIGSPAPSYVESPEISISNNLKRATITAKAYLTEQRLQKPTESWVYKHLLFVLKDGETAIETEKILTKPYSGFSGMVLILIFAAIGGFILNFMPCVLPVITLKVLSIIEHGGTTSASVRKDFMLTSLGIVSTFWLIAASVLVMKNMGLSVGWGIQFQDPTFLVAISIVVGLFAYNLLGWFEVYLPSRVSTALVKAESVESPLQHFLSGAFVTILATPCTAPFLGTAISFALARGAFEIFSILTAMGLGLALPFILIALEPRLATRLPKPGKWMETFKKSLSIPLFATLFWLLWTFSALKGTAAAVLIFVFIALMGLMLYLKHRGTSTALVYTFIAVLSVASFVSPHLFKDNEISKDLSQSSMIKFDGTIIDDLVREGKIVFVDVTADWCITCKANENLVINTKPIQDEFAREDVVAMYADWTKGDKDITSFLRRYGKYGVPFYVVFGPNAPDGLPLSEILTVDSVIEGLREAGLKD